MKSVIDYLYAINEEIKHGDKMYRGHDKDDHGGNHISWHSEHPELAHGYAAHRKSPVVSATTSTSKNTVDLGHDRMHMKPGDVLRHTTDQHKTKKFDKSHKEAYDRFREHFGNHDRKVTDYWNSHENKKHTSKFLRHMGYDSIRMREDDHETLGVLHDK